MYALAAWNLKFQVCLGYTFTPATLVKSRLVRHRLQYLKFFFQNQQKTYFERSFNKIQILLLFQNVLIGLAEIKTILSPFNFF